MFKAVKVLLSGNLLGKVLGLIRELLLAAFFGTTTPVSAYRTAQTATLIPINFFTSDTLNAGFIPLYVRYLNKDLDKAQTFFWSLFFLLGTFSIFLGTFLYFSAKFWVQMLVPGFHSKALIMSVEFLQVMSIGVPFYIVSSLFTYLEMGNKKYILSSIRASVQSIGLILGTLIAFYFKKPVFLAWGFTGAYIFFCSFSLVRLKIQGILTWSSSWKWAEVKLMGKEFWSTIRPLLLLPIMLQGNIAIERLVASFMGVGVVAALDYAKFITETSVTLLAVPLGLAGLTELSGLKKEIIQSRLIKITSILLLLTIPISTFLALQSKLIVSLLYQRGQFDEQSVRVTSSILLGLAIGIWAQIISYFFVKVLNSQLRNREVIIYMAISLVLNIIINLSLYQFLGPLTLGISATINAIILFILSSWALKILKNLQSYILILLLGVLLYLPIGIFYKPEGWAGLFLTGLIFLIYWVIYIMIVPQLRHILFKTKNTLFDNNYK